MFDFSKSKKIFKEYIANRYDTENDKNQLKIIHTYGVIDLAEYIAKDLKCNEQDIQLAKLIALLHDIGRFEQIKNHGDFNDIITQNDHAVTGIKILFDENLIEEFIQDRQYDTIIYKAILNHNKYKIEEGLEERELLHAKIIRDADKTDNFRTKETETIETLLNITAEQLGKEKISDNIYQNFMSNQLIISDERKTPMDMWVSYLAFIFDYNYTSGLKYIMEKDDINKIINRIEYQNRDTKQKMEKIREHAIQYIKNRCKEK